MADKQKKSERALDLATLPSSIRSQRNTLTKFKIHTHNEWWGGVEWSGVDEMALTVYVAMPFVNGIREEFISKMSKLTSSHILYI